VVFDPRFHRGLLSAAPPALPKENQTRRGESEGLASRKMKATRSEDLEFLREIRGCFGSRRMMWSVEYEFTGEEIIERRGGRIKNQIRISDITDTKVKISPHQLMLKTKNSKMTVQITPSLNEVIQIEASKINATKSKAERQHFEKVKQETMSRFKRVNIIGAVIIVLFGFVIALFVGWLKQKY
jgi:hypothetical protein